MTRGRQRSAFSHVAALLAVALLTLAGVRSNVMQAAEAAPRAPACHMGGTMAGMDHGSAPAEDHKAHKACEFCVAASVAPLQSAAPTLPLPVALAWRPLPMTGGPGARGPPAFQPRARGPPRLLNA